MYVKIVGKIPDPHLNDGYSQIQGTRSKKMKNYGTNLSHIFKKNLDQGTTFYSCQNLMKPGSQSGT